jgi:hypothetical protein
VAGCIGGGADPHGVAVGGSLMDDAFTEQLADVEQFRVAAAA